MAVAAPAAYQGRVDTLLVSKGERLWERQVELAAEPSPETEDLLDFAAIHTFLNRGAVYVTEKENLPDGSPIAAILRYERFFP